MSTEPIQSQNLERDSYMGLYDHLTLQSYQGEPWPCGKESKLSGCRESSQSTNFRISTWDFGHLIRLTRKTKPRFWETSKSRMQENKKIAKEPFNLGVRSRFLPASYLDINRSWPGVWCEQERGWPSDISIGTTRKHCLSILHKWFLLCLSRVVSPLKHVNRRHRRPPTCGISNDHPQTAKSFVWVI